MKGMKILNHNKSQVNKRDMRNYTHKWIGETTPKVRFNTRE